MEGCWPCEMLCRMLWMSVLPNVWAFDGSGTAMSAQMEKTKAARAHRLARISTRIRLVRLQDGDPLRPSGAVGNS